MSKIYLDGKLIGKTEETGKLLKEIRDNRKKGVISPEINLRYKEETDEIIINSDSGRVRRPLIIVNNGKPKMTKEHINKLKKGEVSWNDLVKKGIVEYLDAEEEEDAYIALEEKEITKDHTHLELDPLIIFGISASLIPFAEYNRGDRVNYGAKMIGQTLGLYSLNYPLRTDTKSNILVYPQKPLVSTKTYPVLNLEKHPSGQNVVVALLSYKGYNIEDAIIMNKGTIERGFGKSYFYRTYKAEERKYAGGQEDRITIPEKDVRGYRSEEIYSHLDEDGISPPETKVGSNSILIGKVSPSRFLGEGGQDFLSGIQNLRESSVSLRHGEKGIVDKVILSENTNGNKLVKLTVRDERTPEIGDKFATRHGQKGVIGMVAEEKDMPFTEDGITPDIIVNPHSIPSRLTVGQLLELLGGKTGAMKGELIDGTPFNSEKEEDLKKTLNKAGLRSDGKEVFYNGTTGEIMEAEIYTGIIYYQKLEHMVANKIHARSRGPVTLLTKQPTEGRAKDGGLRIGEMEKDTFIAHGAPMLLNERFSSDKVSVPICKKCGLLALEDKIKNKTYCPICKKSEIGYTEIGYAFKLLLNEMKSMLIYPKIKLEEGWE